MKDDDLISLADKVTAHCLRPFKSRPPDPAVTADDLAQEAIIVMLEAKRTFDPKLGSLEARLWFKGCMRIKDILRKQTSHDPPQTMAYDLEDDTPAPNQTTRPTNQATRLFLSGHSISAVARIMNVSRKKVRRILRGSSIEA